MWKMWLREHGRWLAAGAGLMVAGFGLTRFWWFEFGMALVLLGAAALGSLVGLARSAVLDAELTERYRPAARRAARGTTAGAGGEVAFRRRIAYREELAGAGAAGRRCGRGPGRGGGAGERYRSAARRPHPAALRPGLGGHKGETVLAAGGREDGRPRSRRDREGDRGRRAGGRRVVSPGQGRSRHGSAIGRHRADESLGPRGAPAARAPRAGRRSFRPEPGDGQDQTGANPAGACSLRPVRSLQAPARRRDQRDAGCPGGEPGHGGGLVRGRQGVESRRRTRRDEVRRRLAQGRPGILGRARLRPRGAHLRSGAGAAERRLRGAGRCWR